MTQQSSDLFIFSDPRMSDFGNLIRWGEEEIAQSCLHKVLVSVLDACCLAGDLAHSESLVLSSQVSGSEPETARDIRQRMKLETLL